MFLFKVGKICLLVLFIAFASTAVAQVGEIGDKETPTPDAKPTATPTPDPLDEPSTWTLAGLFAGGDGTAKNPFVVKSAEQLGYAMKYRGEHFVVYEADGSRKLMTFQPDKTTALRDYEIRLLDVADTEKTALTSADSAATGSLLTAAREEAKAVSTLSDTAPTDWELIRRCWVYLLPLEEAER